MTDLIEKQTIEITKDFTDFEAIRWVTGVIDCKHSDERTHFLIAEEKRIVGTNGYSLHIASVAIPPGSYDVVRRTQKVVELQKVESDRYPLDIDSVFPQTEPTAVLELDNSDHYTRVIRAMDESVTLNYKYFQDADQWMDKAFIYEPGNPVVLENHHSKALIMPRKMN